MKREFIWAFLLIVVVAPAWGKVFRVPQDYPDIGYTITNYTISGDEIIVSPGTYRGFDYWGWNLNIHSLDPTNPEIVKTTIIKDLVIVGGDDTSTSMPARLAGFTITGSTSGAVAGGGKNSIVEYNHIYGNEAPYPVNGGPSIAGGLGGCDGTIRNNLIEGNSASFGAGLYRCSGIIENNIIARNISAGLSWQGGGGGGALYDCHGTIRNNTIVENVAWQFDFDTGGTWGGGGLVNCTGEIYNNIIWSSDPTKPPEYSGCSLPRYCCITGLTGGGEGNITADPYFVNTAFERFRPVPTLTGLDWHLTSSSLCIDAGMSTATLPRQDFDGIQRGLRGSSSLGRGDGSEVDLGAYEALPMPVAVWLPGGGPETIRHGESLSVAWRCAAPAGSDLRLRLYRDGQYTCDLGIFRSATGTATSMITLPVPLISGDHYAIKGISLVSNLYSAMTGDFRIAGFAPNGVAPERWRKYE